jgi:hypothetical protein
MGTIVIRNWKCKGFEFVICELYYKIYFEITFVLWHGTVLKKIFCKICAKLINFGRM